MQNIWSIAYKLRIFVQYTTKSKYIKFMSTTTKQIQYNNKLVSILSLGQIVVEGSDRSITVDCEKYYLDASFNIDTLDFYCELWIEGECKQLTEDEKEFVAKTLSGEKQEINHAFTNEDYTHFESLIHA